MTRLTWDPTQAPPVRLGLSRGVLYFRSHPIQVWNGLSSISEKSDDSSITEGYFDGQKFAQVGAPSSFSATAQAYTYPPDLESGDVFDLSYRVELDTGYELHIVWNAKAYWNDQDLAVVGSEIDPTLFAWDIFTVPVRLNDYRASAHIVINSNHANPTALALIEDRLYGSSTNDPEMMSVEEIFAIFELYSTFTVVDNGDGTWTATGPDSWFVTLDSTTVEITTPPISWISDDTYIIHSW